MKPPNTIESVLPFSGEYSLKKDLRRNAWLAVAAATYCAAVYLLKHHPEWNPLARALTTLAPMLPGLLYAWDCARFVRGLDELQRRIQLEAWLFAALGSLFIGTILGTFAANGYDLGGLGHGVNLWGSWTLTFTLWLVGTAIARCRYK